MSVSFQEQSIAQGLHIMSSTAITTIVKMLESLPVEVQDRVADHLREYIDNLQDEIRWNKSFQQTQSKLVAAARRAKQEIAEGQATTMDDEITVFFSSASEDVLQRYLGLSALSSAKIEKVAEVASELGMTVSELMEGIGEKQLIVVDTEEMEDLQDLRDVQVSLNEARETGTTSLADLKKELNL